jgi:hypothetical protein
MRDKQHDQNFIVPIRVIRGYYVFPDYERVNGVEWHTNALYPHPNPKIP